MTFRLTFRQSLFALPVSAAALFVSNPAQAQTPKTQPPTPKTTAPKKRSGKQLVAGVRVDGLNRAQMLQRLRRELAPRLNAPLVLSAGTRKTRVKRRDVGIELELGSMIGHAERGDAFVPLELRVNRAKALNALRHVAPRFAVAPRNAAVMDGRKVQVISERKGQTLNVGGGVGRLMVAVGKNARARVVDLPTRAIAPHRTRQDFKGINGRLGSFTTSYNASKVKRTLNMGIAARAINGTIVKPGAVFSLNDTVGERTQARGYRTAVIFANGREEPGIGGGVSQITGTIFNAALVAGLPILTYHTHSRPVVYLPIGRDATVSWGNFDMKWRNNTGAPIYITYRVANGRATATLFGRKSPGQRVRLHVVSKHLGGEKVAAQLYRVIARNGKIIKEKVGDSLYDPKNEKDD